MNYKHLSFLILFLSSLFYADESLNASEVECLPDAKVEFWAKGDAYINGIKQVDKANCYTETDLADSLKVLYNLPDAAISNIRNEAGNSLTEYFNYGNYKTPQTILYAVSVDGQTLNGCRVSVSVLDKLPPYCNDNDPENKKFQLVIDADPMTCKVSAEMVDAELAKHVNDANTHAMNDKIWFRSKAGSNKSVAGSGIKSIVGNWDAMNADGLPNEFPISNAPYTVYYKVSDAAGNTRERTAYDKVAVDGVYPYCYATVTVRKPSPACGNPTITLPATASKCRYDADEVFAELGKMESAGYVCGEERLLEQVIHDKVYRYGVKENFTYKVNSVQCVAQVDITSDKIDCPALSLKKVYDKKGLCNASIADTAALYLKKALQKNADCRINAEYCYIPDAGLGNPVKEDGIATYRFTYLLVDANNKVIDDACEATLVVADASKPACPASSLKLIVPVGPDCIAIAGEAVDFFDNGVASAEKGKKSNCSGASLFADISAFKYVDETTKDEKVGGIIGDMVYDFDWNTSVPLLYRIASNSEFVNPNYCTANVFVKDDAEIRCPDGSDINISTTTDGTALFPTSQLVAPLVCRPNTITATYALKDGNGVEKEISLADLPTYSFAAGTYILSATFSREATDFQSASQKTCLQTINVADATDPVCPSVSETGIRLKNTVCGLDLAGVKTLIELEVGNDRRLDNATNNAELRVTGLSGEPNIVATKEELPHLYTFNLEDKAGNKASCNVEITLIDEEVPSCPETRNVDLTIGNECQTATEVTITGDDNCEIATINWWCDESPETEYLGSECTVKLENLTEGTHTLYWQLQDKAGNQQKGVDGDFCSQKINVYSQPQITLDCDGTAKSFSTTSNCKLEALLDSLPSPIATVYSCEDAKDVVVPVAQYLLNGEILTATELGEKKLELGDYELTTVFVCNAAGYQLECKEQCTQTFSVEDKAELNFSDDLALSAVELLDAATLTVKLNVVKPEVTSCEPVTYSYKVGLGSSYTELEDDYIETNVSKGETLITVKAESGKRTVETDLKIVVADTSVSACDNFTWRGTDYDRTQNVVLEVGSKTEHVDTIKVLKLTINPSKTNEFHATACESYTWNGLVYTESGDFEQVLQTKNGCDSIVTLHLTINRSYRVDTTAVACDAFTWYGDKYEVSGSYPRTFISKNGCDSVVTLRLTINRSYRVDTTAVACDAFIWYGDKYEVSGSYPRTFTAKNGCDSIVTLHLTINRSYRVDTTAVACDEFTWYGDKYEVSGSYPRTFSAKNGCDSVVTLHLTINHSYRVDTTAFACDEFTWYGNKYEVSGDYPRTFISKNGCDSIVTLHLTVNHSYKVDTTAFACDEFTWYGDKYEVSGDYPRTFISKNGCDSVVTLHLTINRSFRVDTTAVACDEFTWYGDKYEVSGSYPRTFTAKNGCDSIVTLHLTINRSYRVDTVAVACDEFTWYGDKYEVSGSYPRTFAAKNGCDSVVTLHLTINRSYRVDTTAVACDEFTWYGDKYEVSGSYPRTFTAKNGCDSVVTLHLTINRSYKMDTTAVACDEFTWYGDKYEVSGSYPRTFTAKNGCDSIVTLHLTINHSYKVDTTAVACDEFIWYGDKYEVSGDYPRTFAAKNGCDSVVTLHLTINRSYKMDTTAVACDAFVWYGTKYEVSGDYPHTFTAKNGCDSVVTLHLTVNRSYKVDTTAVACDEFTWYGTKYEVSGDYARTFTAKNGCDSIVTLHLTINRSYMVDTTAVACDGFVWYGTKYEVSGDYPRTFAAKNGCDSVVTLHLTVNRSYRVDTTAVSCDAFDWYGDKYEVSGDYPRTFMAKNGCDSIVTLHLTINHSYKVDTTAVACDEFIWYGDKYEVSGDYPRTFAAKNGCDSVVTLHLTINRSYRVDTVAVACDEFMWYGDKYEVNGDYARTFTAKNGCDSIVTLHLTVNRSYRVDTTAVACDEFTWYGDKYEVSGDYPRTFTAKNGCDSVVTLHLTINRSYRVDTTAVACDEFTWYGNKYEVSGDYPRTFTAKNGCDSVVTLHLTINRSYRVDTVAVACDEFTWYGDKYEVSGSYPRTFAAKNGCDSVVTLHLTINRSYRVDTTAVACDAFVWYGDRYEVSGDYARTFTAKNGCDSVVTLHLVISNAVHDTIRVTTCGSYTWHDSSYDVSGVYDYTDKSVFGCDSIEILVLTVNQPAVQPIYVYGCDNLYWRGHLYTADTDMSDTLMSVCGCDSVVNYHLRVNKSVTSSIDVVACDEYEWRGHIYTESGVFADTLQTIYGCDSILSLRLTINKSKETIVEAVACDSFLWHGASYTNSGVYERHLTTKTGCDSIVVLHLTINSSVMTQEQKSACGSFIWHNKEIAASGIYYDTLLAVSGCDSVVELVAKVGYSTDVVYSDSVILGNGYHKYGFIISPTAIGHVGDYTFHHDLKSWAGCDSIVTLLLKVYKEPEIIVDDSTVDILPVVPEGYSKPLDSYCVGDTVKIVYGLTSGVADSFSVSFNEELRSAGFLETSGLLSEIQPYFVIPNAAEGGAYVAYLTLYNHQQQSEPIEVPFRVGLPNTVIERMWNDVVVCNRKGQDFVKYQWYKNGKEIEGATKQYYQDFEYVVGSYGLTVWNSDGQRIDFCPRAFEELAAPYAFVVTPNPTKPDDVFEVLVQGVDAAEMQYARLFVYNASGVLLETVTEVKEVNKMALHNSGTYTIILNVNGGQVATSKVLVRP